MLSVAQYTANFTIKSLGEVSLGLGGGAGSGTPAPAAPLTADDGEPNTAHAEKAESKKRVRPRAKRVTLGM